MELFFFLALLQDSIPGPPTPTTPSLPLVAWIAIGASLLGGGATGAIINTLVTRYRNRQQPVFYTLQVVEIFNKEKVYGLVKTSLTIEDASGSGIDLVVENFAVAILTLVNEGNNEIEEFNFGVTLADHNHAFNVNIATPDRHHLGTCLTPPTATELKHEIDFRLKPFNRKDSYQLEVYFTYFDSIGEIKVTSGRPERFVRKRVLQDPDVQKTLLRIVKWMLVIMGLQLLWNLLSVFKILPPPFF